MEHILNPDENLVELDNIFRKMKEANTILFLGAGASVGEKKYLSSQIIELYEQKIGKKLGEPSITNWLDILSADPKFSRANFDDFVFDLLKKLKITDAHKVLATVPWAQIITTNFDLLVEQAYDEISLTSEKMYDLISVRNLKELSYRTSHTEVKYVKLHGCMKDKSKYPFSFSTDDFMRLKSHYRNVLGELRNLSPNIAFISIGYSYVDSFGKQLLDEFDKYNYRDKKWMINVDPYPNEAALPFYSKNRVCIVKLSFVEFFERYKKWELMQTESLVKKRGLSFYDNKNQFISIPPKLLINLSGIIRQLNQYNSSTERVIKDVDFYKGEEPNFNVVTRGLDVVKTGYIEDFKVVIKDVLFKNTSTLIPIFFVSGDFGIGKSTTTLRLIYEFCKDPGENVVAFEIVDLMNTKKELLLDLIHQVKSERVILFVDDVEVESSFKGLLDLQRELSIEQIQQSEVVLIVPIRGNILEKFRLNRDILNFHILNLDGKLTEGEINDLLEKLKNATLISFRDAAEKSHLVTKIQREYNSDSFISLMATITSGRHENDLIHSYNQLSKDAQNAFLFTALLHKHKLLMPASLLKQNVSMSWDDFILKVVKAEGKGLLIQVEKFSHGTQPDLYFRTKHPLIADRLVNKIIPNVDKQYKMYESMLRGIEPGVSNSYLVNDLLKGFIKFKEFNETQINKLFDAGFTKLSDDPYFLLNYAINLQSRRTIHDLKKALDLLIYAESLLEYRNHRFIHRRGVISFELAKLYAETAKHSYMQLYLREAEDLLYTKQLMDPFSSYSYVDYIKMLLWEIKIMNFDKETIIQKIIKIEDLFEVSNKLVDDGLNRIHSLTTDYAECLKDISDNTEYKQFLQNLYEDFHLKPYACILLYNHYNYLGNKGAAEQYVSEMEYYKDNFEVVKFLFKYYGRRLYDANNRVKFLTLSRENPHLENQNSFRYNFFNFIAESYNYQFSEGRRYLYSLQTKGYNINPEFHEIWLDPTGEEVYFDAIIIKDKWARYKSVKIPVMQQQFKLLKGNYDIYVEGTRVSVKLHFYLYGIIAEIKRF